MACVVCVGGCRRPTDRRPSAALLASDSLDRGTERERQPVFFDVLGALVLAARAPAAALLVAAALAALTLCLHRSATEAAKAREHNTFYSPSFTQLVLRLIEYGGGRIGKPFF